MNDFINKNKTKILIVMAIVVVVLFALSGNELYDYVKKQQTTLKNDVTKLQEDNKALKDSLVNFKDIISTLDVKEDNYYSDYVREYNKRIKAEKSLKDIRYLVFDKAYLDSLKTNVEYK